MILYLNNPWSENGINITTTKAVTSKEPIR
jgi:hypothetical protein